MTISSRFRRHAFPSKALAAALQRRVGPARSAATVVLTPLALCAAQMVWAQTSPEAGTAAPASTGSTQLREIRITGSADSGSYREEEATSGTKISAPLRDIPVSVQVIPRQVMEDQGALRTYDLMQNVSGVYRGNPSFGSDDFVFRGFSNSVYLRDGIPAGRSSSREKAYRDTANVEQIEVLKGPASVLYGRLEPGGTLNYVTKKPLLMPRYEASLRLDSFGLARSTVDLSNVWNEGKLGIRVNGAYEKGSGFRDFSFSDRSFGSAVITWRPSSDTQLSLDLEVMDDRRLFDRSGIPLLNGSAAPIPVSRSLNEPTDFKHVKETLFGYTLDHRLSSAWQFKHALRAYRSTSEGQLTSTRTASLSNAVTTTVDPLTGNIDRQFSTENYLNNQLITQFELIGDLHLPNGMRHQPLLGLELDHSDGQENGRNANTFVASNRINVFNPVYGRFTPVNLRQNSLTESALKTSSIYAQDLIELRPDWKLLVGARYDSIDSNTTVNRLNNTTSSSGGSALSPRAGVVWQPTSELSLYASYSESFVPVLGQDFFGQAFKPTTGQQVELGAKSEWFGGRLTATAAIFQIAKQNISVTDPDHAGFSIQTGEITSDGVEFDLAGSPMAGLNLIGNIAFTKARVTEDTRPLMIGTRVSNTPNVGAGLSASYQMQDPQWRAWGGNVGVQYVGSRENSNNARDFHVLPAYSRWDMSIWYRAKPWKVSVRLENLTNKVYFVSGVNLGLHPGAPRNLSVTATYQF